MPTQFSNRGLLPTCCPRKLKTKILNHYVYNDKDDLFAREPFVAQFTLPSKGRTAEGWGVGGRQWSGAGGSTRPAFVVLPSLVLVPLHTTPKAVEKELNALYDVFLDVTHHWQTEVGLESGVEWVGLQGQQS